MAANRVAADNPLHEETAEGLIPEGRFPRITHPYPCGGCAAFHDDESGFCAQCSRRLVPPHTVAMLARMQRKLYLCLLTLIMSIFETGDKAIIVIFALSTTIVVLFWFMTKAVASQEPGPWIAAFVLVFVAAILCGPVVRRMIKNIEAVDAIANQFDTASKKLLVDHGDEERRGPASFKPAVPRSQPSWELRDLYVLARERRDLFAVDVLEVLARAGKQATEPSRAIRGPSVKGLARAREKTNLDYGGDASRLRDVLRGSVVCETVDELNVVVDALRAVKDVEVIRIKNRFRDKPTPSGYRDVNINIDYHGMVIELQLHLSEVLQVADKQHVAYEAARELDLMGVLEKPDGLEAAPVEATIAYTLARTVPALLSLLVAILYLDAFTLKGLRLIVRRAQPATWRGFKQPYIVHRVYGIALAAPYLANVYLLARAAGLFGEAAKDARRGRTRIGLLYEKYFGYEGSHFVWKVFCFQIVEVALQAAGKIPLFLTYVQSTESVTFWFVYVFNLALLVNVLYPTLLLRSRLVRSQAVLIPHEPVAYVSNLIPLMHAHFVISTLERAGAEARALKRVAPNESAADEAPKRAAPGDSTPNGLTGVDAPAPDTGTLPDDARAEPSKPVPLGATPAGRHYCGLICLCLFFWTLAMGFFYTENSVTKWFVSQVLKIRSSCTWEVEKEIDTWQERACDPPCEEIPGCDQPDLVACSWGTCITGTLDVRCFGKENGYYFDDDGWCWDGRRDQACVAQCDPPCEERPGCDQPDLVTCRWGECITGTVDDRCDDKENWFDIDDDGWCMDGRRDEYCGDEDRIGCYNNWPDYPGNHSYDTFTDSGKCSRMKDWAAWVPAHNLDVGTVADIDECWSRCQDLNEDGKTSYCASMHQTTMECSCQGADLNGDFDELVCLEDVGDYTLAVHEGWRGSRCYGNDGRACGCDGGDYCLPYGACCVEHSFRTTGEVANTTCHGDRSPWEAETFSLHCTAGHSDAGAVAPAFRNCSQAAIDAGSCGTRSCAECAAFSNGTYFAHVGYTSCPSWVVDAIDENAADGGTCSDALTERTKFWRDTYSEACSFQLWEEFKKTDGGKARPRYRFLGLFALFSLVCLPFTLSFMALPTLAERAGRRVASIWRRRIVGFILFCFILLGLLLATLKGINYVGPIVLIFFLVVMGYTTAVVTEERVKLGAFCSVVIFLTVYWMVAVGLVVLGCAAVAFAPRSGERKKVRSAVFTTKASAAADRGRLPRWACCVYFCATSTFIALAGFGVFSTDPSSCSPCNCKENTLIDCYADAKTLELTDSSWNGIQSYLPRWVNLANDGIKAIEPGAFEGMSRLEELVLKKNRISTIEPNTFAGLGKLWYLDLGKNKIQVVKSNAFLGLHNLEEIDLKWNRITRLEDGAFAGLDRLQWLELDGNPVITCADARAAGLPESVSCRD